jgi:hypothetical protein
VTKIESRLLAVVSDSHLRPGRDESKKIARLAQVYACPQVQRVELLGDIDELCPYSGTWGIDSHRRITNDNRQALSFMHDKPTFRHAGNHDLLQWLDPSCLADLGQTLVTTPTRDITINGLNFRLEHGHLCTFNTLFMNANGHTPVLLDRSIDLMVRLAHYFLGNHTGHRLFGRRHNENAKKNKPAGVSRIIGHTHYFQMDVEAGFYNTGCLLHDLQGLAIGLDSGRVYSLQDVLSR